MNENELALAVTETLRKGEGPTAIFRIVLCGVGPGWARAALTLEAAALNGHGDAHGGVLFTLADTVFAYACNSRNVATVAQAASITYLSPGRPGERIVAEAREAAIHGRSGVFDVHLTGEDGRVVAIFQGLARALGRPVIPFDDRRADTRN